MITFLVILLIPISINQAIGLYYEAQSLFRPKKKRLANLPEEVEDVFSQEEIDDDRLESARANAEDEARKRLDVLNK